MSVSIVKRNRIFDEGNRSALSVKEAGFQRFLARHRVDENSLSNNQLDILRKYRRDCRLARWLAPFVIAIGIIGLCAAYQTWQTGYQKFGEWIPTQTFIYDSVQETRQEIPFDAAQVQRHQTTLLYGFKAGLLATTSLLFIVLGGNFLMLGRYDRFLILYLRASRVSNKANVNFAGRRRFARLPKIIGKVAAVIASLDIKLRLYRKNNCRQTTRSKVRLNRFIAQHSIDRNCLTPKQRSVLHLFCRDDRMIRWVAPLYLMIAPAGLVVAFSFWHLGSLFLDMAPNHSVFIDTATNSWQACSPEFTSTQIHTELMMMFATTPGVLVGLAAFLIAIGFRFLFGLPKKRLLNFIRHSNQR